MLRVSLWSRRSFPSSLLFNDVGSLYPQHLVLVIANPLCFHLEIGFLVFLDLFILLRFSWFVVLVHR